MEYEDKMGWARLGKPVALATSEASPASAAPQAPDYTAFNAAMGYTQQQTARGPRWTDRNGAVVPVATINDQYTWWTKEAAPTAARGADPAMLINYKQFEEDPATVTAAITRKQWEDYQSRFVPFENRLMGMTSYNNPAIVQQEIRAAIGGADSERPTGYVQGALDNAAGQQQRTFQRFGMAPSERQQAAIASQSSLTRSKAVTDAANRIRRNIADRNMQVASGAVPNAGRSYGLRDPGPVAEQ